MTDHQIDSGGRVDVPRGVVHRLANEQDDGLIIIEVQFEGLAFGTIEVACSAIA